MADLNDRPVTMGTLIEARVLASRSVDDVKAALRAEPAYFGYPDGIKEWLSTERPALFLLTRDSDGEPISVASVLSAIPNKPARKKPAAKAKPSNKPKETRPAADRLQTYNGPRIRITDEQESSIREARRRGVSLRQIAMEEGLSLDTTIDVIDGSVYFYHKNLVTITSTQKKRIQCMLASGMSLGDIANTVKMSATTLEHMKREKVFL